MKTAFMKRIEARDRAWLAQAKAALAEPDHQGLDDEAWVMLRIGGAVTLNHARWLVRSLRGERPYPQQPWQP